MQDRVAELESRLDAFEERLRALEEASPAEPAPDQVAPEPSLGDGFVANASTHIGRVLLIFGGAYLLRAITDAQFVPTGVGISMGAIYALFWLVMAHRKGQAESQRATAAFYGGTSVLLALPLLVEAVTKFALLSGQQGVIALAVYVALALTVAATQNLRSLGWLVTAGGIGTAFAVMMLSRAAVPSGAFLLLLGLGSMWAVYWRGWMGVQWLGALGANAGALALIVLSGSDQWSLEPATAALSAGVLLLIYVMSFGLRSQVHARDLGIFEAVQGVLATGIAFWAAIAAARADQLGLTFVGVSSLVLGGSAYALALLTRNRTDHRRNFYFFSSFGLLYVVAGSALIMSPTAAAVVWSLLALTTAWFSGRTGWVILSLQCTVLLLAAGASSGLLSTGLEALAADASLGWPVFVPWHAGIALTTVACLFIPVAHHSKRWGMLAGLPQLTVLALSVWEVGGLIVMIIAPLLADAGAAEPNLAAIAALRTAVLAMSSVTLALSSRFRRWPEARWLVYPVLILVGIKLFVEDFPNGQPASLFVALVFVGGALLLVARLLSRRDTAS